MDYCCLLFCFMPWKPKKLGFDKLPLIRPIIFYQRNKADSIYTFRNHDFENIKHRRKYINRAYRLLNNFRLKLIWVIDQKRDMYDLLVQGPAVLEVSMVIKFFSAVSRNDD